MRHLAILAAGMLLIGANGSAGAAGVAPPGMSPASDLPQVQLVQDTITKRVKRAWKDLVGYKFDVSCPIIFPINHRTCTETGKNREEARSKCASRNSFCYIADAN